MLDALRTISRSNAGLKFWTITYMQDCNPQSNAGIYQRLMEWMKFAFCKQIINLFKTLYAF